MWQMDYDAAAAYWQEKDKESKKMDEAALLEKMEAFVRENNTCALATGSGADLRCTPIEYVYLDDCFYFLSEGGLKFRGLKENEHVGIALYEPYQGFGTLRGLQICGTASMVEPFCEEYLRLLEARKVPVDVMRKLPRPMNLIRVTPMTWDYLDSGLKKEGFGTRQHLKA